MRKLALYFLQNIVNKLKIYFFVYKDKIQTIRALKKTTPEVTAQVSSRFTTSNMKEYAIFSLSLKWQATFPVASHRMIIYIYGNSH